MKNKKLKRTAMFVGIFLGAILLTFVLGTLFRAPVDSDYDITTATIESTTMPAETTMIEETTTAESTIENTTTESGTTQPATTTSTMAMPSTRPPATTTIPPATTRAPTITSRVTTTTRPPVTTARPTTRTTTTRPATTTIATNTLIAYAVNHGRSIGLVFRPQLTSGGVAVGATQAQVRARLDGARAAGAREFNVWSQGGTIFIATR